MNELLLVLTAHRWIKIQIDCRSVFNIPVYFANRTIAVFFMLTFLLLRRRFATAAIDAVAKKVGRPKAENKQSSKKTATTRKTAEPKFDLARITKASLNAVLSNPELDEAKERLTKMQLEAKQKKTEIQIAAKERLAQMQMEAMEKKAQMRIKSTDKSELLGRKISEAEATTGVETETETATKTGTKTETDANVKSKILKSEPFQSTRKTLKPVVFRKKTTLELFNEKKKLEAKAAKANDPELLEAIAEAETYALTVENIRFDFYRHFDDEVYGMRNFFKFFFSNFFLKKNCSNMWKQRNCRSPRFAVFLIQVIHFFNFLLYF